MSKGLNCNSFKSKEECDADDKCFWGKDSSKTERCGDASTAKKKANLISIDLSFEAPIPLEDIETTNPELENVWDIETLLRLLRALGSFGNLFEHEYFKNYLFYNRDEKSKDALTSFFVKVFKIPENKKEEYKKIIKNRINKIIERLEKEGTVKINQDELKRGVSELPEVPSTPPEAVEEGETPSTPPATSGAVTPESPTPETPPPPSGGESTSPPGPGTIVYEPGPNPNSPPAKNLAATNHYSLANKPKPPKQSPALPPRKQPFNIEKEMRKSGLTEQQFPGFWGLDETLK